MPTDTNNTNDPIISLDDIRAAISIFDLACDAGAFKGWDTVQQVLTVRQRFSAFYNHTLEVQKAALAEARDKAAAAAANIINQ